jgi:hypothetical protein
MNTNQRANEIRLKQFKEELELMLEDVRAIDKKVLTKAVNVGLADVKKNTPVDTGFLRRMWFATPTLEVNGGVEKELFNAADYALYVNNGHRIVRYGKTVGFKKGEFMLEKAIGKVDKAMVEEFRKEVEEVTRKHGK